MRVGYARVSTVGQSLDIQEAALREAGCERTFTDKASGTTTDGRAGLEEALAFVREGDVLVCTRLDRLARSSTDLHGIVSTLNAKGVGFICLQQGAVDTTSSTGKLVLAMLGAVAEFENDLRRDRQMEGIAKAKARGVYLGRPPTKDLAARVLGLGAAGVGPVEIARQLGRSRMTIYRTLKKAGRTAEEARGQPEGVP